MYRSIIALLFLLLTTVSSHAHEMIPTYPKFKSSYLDGLMMTEMELFNKRSDVDYYEIGVFDKDFNSIPFVSSFTVYKVDYLQRIKFEVYIRMQDEQNVTYICSRSRVLEQKVSNTSVTSTICSKVKRK